MCIASSHISVTVDLVTDTVVFLFEKKKMQIGEVALKTQRLQVVAKPLIYNFDFDECTAMLTINRRFASV